MQSAEYNTKECGYQFVTAMNIPGVAVECSSEEMSAVPGKANDMMKVGDLDEAKQYYADDMVLFTQEDGIITGQQECLEAMETGSQSVEFNTEIKTVCGKFGVVLGSFTFKEEGSEEEKGYFCTVLNKQEDGKWRIKCEMEDV